MKPEDVDFLGLIGNYPEGVPISRCYKKYLAILFFSGDQTGDIERWLL